MILKEHQLRHLGSMKEEQFEARLLRHVRRFFPGETRSLDRKALLGVCRFGTEKARAYGLRSERDLCKFINLLFVFGLEFDTSPRFPWARRILGKETVGPTLRVNRLYLEALKHEAEGDGLFPTSPETSP